VAKELKELGIELHLSRTKVKVKETLVKDGVLEIIPEHRFHSSVHHAVNATMKAVPRVAPAGE